MDGEISPEELASMLAEDTDDPAIVDIRHPNEFEQGHIPDSLNIPLSQLPQHVAQLTDQERVVTVCPHGKASVRAARLINSFEDFDGRVESLESGLTGWDGPIETADEGASNPPQSAATDTDDDTDNSQTPDAPF